MPHFKVTKNGEPKVYIYERDASFTVEDFAKPLAEAGLEAYAVEKLDALGTMEAIVSTLRDFDQDTAATVADLLAQKIRALQYTARRVAQETVFEVDAYASELLGAVHNLLAGV